MAATPDGNVWFTDYGANAIGYITPKSAIHEFPDPSPYNGLNALTVGPDGALWFTRQDGVIGRLTTTGALITTKLSTPNSQPDGVTSGPNKTLWFTELGANRIGSLRLGAG
jgi:virginiamycin B lyase